MKVQPNLTLHQLTVLRCECDQPQLKRKGASGPPSSRKYTLPLRVGLARGDTVTQYLHQLSTRTSRRPLPRGIPTAFFALHTNRLYRHDTSPNQPMFNVPLGIRLVCLSQHSLEGNVGIRHLISDPKLLEPSCRQQSNHRWVSPALLLSQPNSNSDTIPRTRPYDLCNSINQQFDPCTFSANLNNVIRYDLERRNRDCVATVYDHNQDGNSGCSNYAIGMKSQIIGNVYAKMGIYPLPRPARQPLEVVLPTPSSTVHWLQHQCFKGGFMPEYREGTVRDSGKILDDPAEMYQYWDGRKIYLGDLVSSLPRGTHDNPIVYFITGCDIDGNV